MDKKDQIILSTLLSLVQDGICFLSPELEVLYQNPAMQYWYESAKEPRGEKCYTLYQGRTAPCENCPAQRALSSGKAEEQEVLFVKDSRRSGWQKVFCAPVYGEDGQIELIVEYVRNLTDERNAVLSAELVESQNRVLMDLLNQREEEQLKLEQRRAENMNQSISSVLRYLRATLDSHSYDLISRQLELLKESMGASAPEHVLSGQELAIARSIANGYMSKEIADRMNLSKKTVDYHRSNIRKKLELGPKDDLRQALLAYFSKTGITPLE